jgi:hypothetical protein
MLRIGALVKAGMDPFPVSDDFTLLVRQAPIIQLLMTANSLGITDRWVDNVVGKLSSS